MRVFTSSHLSTPNVSYVRYSAGMSSIEYSPASHVTRHRDAPELPELVLGWLGSFSSHRTREGYHRDLERFSGWLEQHRAGSLLEASRVHVDLYARALEEAGYRPASRARALSALSSFYAYGLSVGAFRENPANSVRRPKLPNYSPRLGLNLETAPRVVEASGRLSPEHRGIVALCFYTGLRISEALSVSARDLREEAGHRVVSVVSKGGREDLVPVSPVAYRLLSELLELRPDGPLLGGMDRFRAYRLVAELGREAGLERKLTPHDLRHGTATCSLEAGEPIHRVQQLLRHASPVTTQRYDHSRDRLDASAAYGLARAVGAFS